MKVGTADANADCARVEAGAEFLNSSAGDRPTIQGFPTYPIRPWGRVFAQATRWLSLGAGEAHDRHPEPRLREPGSFAPRVGARGLLRRPPAPLARREARHPVRPQPGRAGRKGRTRRHPAGHARLLAGARCATSRGRRCLRGPGGPATSRRRSRGCAARSGCRSRGCARAARVQQQRGEARSPGCRAARGPARTSRARRCRRTCAAPSSRSEGSSRLARRRSTARCRCCRA